MLGSAVLYICVLQPNDGWKALNIEIHDINPSPWLLTTSEYS